MGQIVKAFQAAQFSAIPYEIKNDPYLEDITRDQGFAEAWLGPL